MEKKRTNSELSPEQLIQLGLLAATIEDAMWTKRCFLKTNLRVMDIAKLIGSNDKYVSQAINEVLHCGFNEYVNRLRIAFATTQLKEHPDMTLTEIAHNSGYSSLNTFYRNRKLYGRDALVSAKRSRKKTRTKS